MSLVQAAGEWRVGLAAGSVTASEWCYYMKNRNYRADGTVPGFIWCSGYGYGAFGILGAGFAMELARRGYPVVAGDFGDTPTRPGKTDGPGVWGSDAAIAKLTLYKTFLQGALGAKAGKIGLLYGSHGCALAYSWAKANPTLVYCLAGGIGACDVEDIRANNRNSYQASIETAYTNNAGWQAARATHNPVEVAASLSIPQLDYYSTDDPICVPSTHAALLAAAGANMTQRSLGAVGHAFTGLGPLRTDTNVSAFADWCETQVAA